MDQTISRSRAIATLVLALFVAILTTPGLAQDAPDQSTERNWWLVFTKVRLS